ncbi:MAG: hypothetical protein U0871_25105 [Gemmataceae bacterium]
MTPTDSTTLLPAGADPMAAEAAVQAAWMLGHSAEAIAWKAGLPLAYVRLQVDRIRAVFRDAGTDWKIQRGERLLALNEDLRSRLHDRIRTAPDGKFSVADIRELRELMHVEMRQLGLLSPEKFQQVEPARTYDELAELCRQAGIPVPSDNYGPDPPALPAAPQPG